MLQIHSRIDLKFQRNQSHHGQGNTKTHSTH